ncbi:MAG: hypothetical protein E6K39_17925, partial [Gammaproteobacteria bacterium]
MIYAVAGTECLLSGVGGPAVNRWLGMFVMLPAAFTGLVMTVATARRAAPGAGRSAWICLSIALTLYFIGLTIGAGSWLMHREPFPGPADFFFCAFYPAIAAAALYL